MVGWCRRARPHPLDRGAPCIRLTGRGTLSCCGWLAQFHSLTSVLLSAHYLYRGVHICMVCYGLEGQLASNWCTAPGLAGTGIPPFTLAAALSAQPPEVNIISSKSTLLVHINIGIARQGSWWLVGPRSIDYYLPAATDGLTLTPALNRKTPTLHRAQVVIIRELERRRHYGLAYLVRSKTTESTLHRNLVSLRLRLM
ncbi:hypothetical protein CBL_04218 [Carabus blaptoides fortunei]